MAIDPQGYPVQQYTNLKGSIVQEILSDGTIVLITGITISSGTGSPAGVVTAPVGSLYIDKNGVAPNILYQKQVGVDNNGWFATGGSGSPVSISNVIMPAPAGPYSGNPAVLIKDTNGNGVILITFLPGSGSGFAAWIGPNALAPTNLNFTTFIDVVDGGIHFNDIYINAQSGDIQLQNQGTVVLDAGFRIGNVVGKPGVAILNNLIVGAGSGAGTFTDTLLLKGTHSPTSAGTAGTAGEVTWDGTNLYLCTVSGGVGAATWKKLTLLAV